MTRGWGCDGSLRALRNRRLAAAASRNADSRKSICGTGGIDGPIEVTPTALHSNIRLIDTPGFVGRLEMTAQPLFQFGTVTLNPTPDRRVIRLQTAFGEQLFDIAERERVPKIPAHGTKNQLRRRLPPLEDCRSGYVLHNLFRLPATPAKVATHPAKELGTRVREATGTTRATVFPASPPPRRRSARCAIRTRPWGRSRGLVPTVGTSRPSPASRNRLFRPR